MSNAYPLMPFGYTAMTYWLWMLTDAQLDQLEHGEVVMHNGQLCYVEWITSDKVKIYQPMYQH